MYVYTDHNFKFNLGGANCSRCNVPWADLRAEESPRYGLLIGTADTTDTGYRRCLCGLRVQWRALPARYVTT